MFKGFSTTTPLSTTEKQVSDLREAWKKASEKSIAQISQYSELVKFTNALSDSYVHTIKVVIDVSSLLNSYNALLGDMLTGLKDLEVSMNTGVSSSDVEQLRNQTLKQIDDINNIFKDDFNKISKAVYNASNDAELRQHVTDTKTSIEKLNTSPIKNLLNKQNGGKRARRAKKTQ